MASKQETKESVKVEIDGLSKLLHKYNHLYYVEDSPMVSDKEFDSLLEKLVALETEHPEFRSKNSPTQRVGGAVTKSFETVVHDYPMLSLGNSYSREDLEEFEGRVNKVIEGKIEFTAELKYDGVAIALKYENGELVQAVTRGDGVQGDDVTANVRTIKSIPLKLKGNFPPKFEIRGEIFMSKESFKKLNELKEEAGEALMANPRNTASGTLKMQDSKQVAERNLDCYLYYMIGEDLPCENHFDNLKAAGEWGFKVPAENHKFIQKCNGVSKVFDFIDYWDSKKEDLGFEVDGIVIKVNNSKQQELLGNTTKSPRWAIAYKFETERVATLLEDVVYQVGRTGSVTPVANLKAVELLGTTVKRASLHNEDFIENFDLHMGDEVYVEKGGEIIPKVVGVNVEQRATGAIKIVHKKECPICENELVRKEGEANYYCVNVHECPPQITGRIQHFIGRKAMNIDGLGDETIELLYREKIVKNYADLYDLKFDDLIPLERMAEKSVNNLLNGIEESKKVSFTKVLFALGIRFVGQTVAKKLAQGFKSLDALMKADIDALVAVDEIGEVIAKSVVDFFGEEKNIEVVNRLRDSGVQLKLKDSEVTMEMEGVLTGKSIVVSGVFEKYSRTELKLMIEQNGGKNVSGISKSTSYVLAGDKMGPSKKEKAEKLGVMIISEGDFLNMLDLN